MWKNTVSESFQIISSRCCKTKVHLQTGSDRVWRIQYLRKHLIRCSEAADQSPFITAHLPSLQSQWCSRHINVFMVCLAGFSPHKQLKYLTVETQCLVESECWIKHIVYNEDLLFYVCHLFQVEMMSSLRWLRQLCDWLVPFESSWRRVQRWSWPCLAEQEWESQVRARRRYPALSQHSNINTLC